MLTHYLTLGLAPGASDEEIRRSYLQLVKENPPARSPERFRMIASAYEAIKDRRSRVRSAVLGTSDSPDCEAALLELRRARSLRGARLRLKDIAIAEGLSDGE